MIQRWKREKSAGDQNCPAGIFPFVFQNTSDDDGCSMDYVPSNPSSQFIEECEKNNISKTALQELAGDQNCLAGIFPFVFHDTFDDDVCSMDYVPSNPSGQFIEEYEKNNIYKIQHDPTDRKSTRLNSSHPSISRMPSSA